MLIRCARCRALFSVQDVVPAAGARLAVQCGRCLAVFESGGVSKAPALHEAEPTPVPAQPVTPAPPGRDARARPPLSRALLLRAAAGLTAVALAGAVIFAVRQRWWGSARDVAARVEQGRQKLLRDDARSLDEATRLFTEAVRMAPGDAVPEAERGFALLLQALAHKDLADRSAPPARDEEARLANRFAQQGGAAAKQALAENEAEPAALRAMALFDVVNGEIEQASAHAAAAQRADPQDPWSQYAGAAAARSRKAPAEAAAILSRLRTAQPRMLRAHVDLAAVLLDGGNAVAARGALQQVLQDNAAHERARRLLALVSAGP